jgi:hypothetical protein
MGYGTPASLMPYMWRQGVIALILHWLDVSWFDLGILPGWVGASSNPMAAFNRGPVAEQPHASSRPKPLGQFFSVLAPNANRGWPTNVAVHLGPNPNKPEIPRPFPSSHIKRCTLTKGATSCGNSLDGKVTNGKRRRVSVPEEIPFRVSKIVFLNRGLA